MHLSFLEAKWRKFSRYAGFFRHLPFTEAVLASGSMALGKTTANSDFDVIVIVKSGRMFTARFFALLLFTLWGARRRGNAKRDRLCFNQFATEEGYPLKAYNPYLERLHQNAMPLYGEPAAMERFFQAHEMSYEETDQSRYIGSRKTAVRQAIEAALGGGFGDAVEGILSFFQIRHIRRVTKGLQLPKGVRLDDKEVGNFGFYLKN